MEYVYGDNSPNFDIRKYIFTAISQICNITSLSFQLESAKNVLCFKPLI